MLSLVDAAGREIPFPTNLLAATPYHFQVRASGYAPVKSEWSLRQDDTVLTSGESNHIRFTAPEAALTIYVRALLSSGFWAEEIFSFSAGSRRSVDVTVGVVWSRTIYSENATLRARMAVTDPEGLLPASITWQLFRNSALVASGASAEVGYDTASPGVYRVHAVVVDGAGETHTADGTTYVQGGFELQTSIVPVQPTGTIYHLGDVFLNPMQVDAGVSSELPVVTSSVVCGTFLLPGTTHYKFDLVGNADDEVVVRTAIGNWALIGPPTGLATERVGYDYSLPSVYLLAPTDLCLKIGVDVWNVRGYAYAASAFSVRVRCFRNGPLLNTYAPCPCAAYTGGDGNRTRKLAVMFSEVNLELDVEHGGNRLGSAEMELFSTALPTTFLATLASSGSPHTADPTTGYSLSKSNLVTTYEPERADLAELDARGVTGLADIRPFITTFSQFGNPHIVQRLKRLGGRVACYLSDGAVEEGAVITVGIETSSSGVVNFQVPVSQTVYAPDGTFVKVGEIALEVTDYDFSPGGFVAHLSVQDKLVNKRTERGQDGTFKVVNRRSEPTVAGQFKVVLGEHAVTATQTGRFKVVGVCVYRRTHTQSGQFSVVNARPSHSLNGAFLVSAS